MDPKLGLNLKRAKSRLRNPFRFSSTSEYTPVSEIVSGEKYRTIFSNYSDADFVEAIRSAFPNYHHSSNVGVHWFITHLVGSKEDIYLVDKNLGIVDGHPNLTLPFLRYGLDRKLHVHLLADEKKIDDSSSLDGVIGHDNLSLHSLSQEYNSPLLGISGGDAYVQRSDGASPLVVQNSQDLIFLLTPNLNLFLNTSEPYQDKKAFRQFNRVSL